MLFMNYKCTIISVNKLKLEHIQACLPTQLWMAIHIYIHTPNIFAYVFTHTVT